MDRSGKLITLSLFCFIFLMINKSFAQPFYTAYNVWYEHPKKVWAINYQKGKLLPLGTEIDRIKVAEGRRPYLTFRVPSLNEEFIIYFNIKYHPKVSIQMFKDRFVTSQTFDESVQGLSPLEIKAIRKGKVEPGMSKKAVILCQGFPPEHRTKSLKNNTWLYWSNRFKSYKVQFGADGLTVGPKGKPGPKEGSAPDLSKDVVTTTPVKKTDTTPPEIEILQPAVARGMKVKHPDKTVLVKGKASDPSGVFEVLVNGVEANLSGSGEFWAEILLAVGENDIRVRATDTHKNAADQLFTIIREETYSAPIPEVAASVDVPLSSGVYYALIIGVQDYTHPSINDLDQPLNDARRLQSILVQKYTFDPKNVYLLQNPDRSTIISTFDNLSRQLQKNDNLLIFYAGHGYWDDKFEQGYWLPSDAAKDNRSNWISNSTVVDFIRGIDTKHTLLVADACFSGGIFKTRSAFSDAAPAVTELYKLPSRKAITSGTLKEVPDRSVFVEYLTKRLDDNSEKYITSEQLFTSFRTAVINNSPIKQVPQFGEIRQCGDEGGDFVFIRK